MNASRASTCAAVIAALVLFAPWARAEGSATGSITGRVLDAGANPIAGAVVFVLRVAKGTDTVAQGVSGPDGAFRFDGLRHGVFVVVAQGPDGGAILPETGGDLSQAISHVGDDVTLRAASRGVITGTVTSDTGEPVVGVTVRAVPTGRLAGILLGLAGNWVERRTDDRGVYRLWGVPAGGYLVVAGEPEPDASPLGYLGPFDDLPLIYHPGTSKADAAEVTVSEGAETPGVDIRFAPAPGRTISGTIEGAPSGATVVLSHASTGEIVTARAVAPDRPIPVIFALPGVIDGDYEVLAISSDEDGVTATARRRVTVRGADVAGITLALAPVKFGSIAGRLVVEPASKPLVCDPEGKGRVEETLLTAARDEPTSETRDMDPAKTPFSLAVPDGAGAFRLERLAAARYRLDHLLSNPTWYVRAITTEQPNRPAVDLSASGIEVAAGANVTGVKIAVATGAPP